MSGWIKASVFLAGSVVGGLAVAFLVVMWRPDLLLAMRGEAATINAAAETAMSDADDRSAASSAPSSRPAPLTPSVSGAVTIVPLPSAHRFGP
ncbi:MAG: hypothetical protein ACO3OV_05330, partial [Steroidobacteraceae bacterium]